MSEKSENRINIVLTKDFWRRMINNIRYIHLFVQVVTGWKRTIISDRENLLRLHCVEAPYTKSIRQQQQQQISMYHELWKENSRRNNNTTIQPCMYQFTDDITFLQI